MRLSSMVIRLCLAVIFVLAVSPLAAEEKSKPLVENPPQPATGTQTVQPAEKLVVVWTSGDRDVALKMVFMYTYNASESRFGWWKDITLIVWGPSAKLLSEDKELQEYVTTMKKAGITLEACKACSDMYEVSGQLEKLGIDVKYMGQQLTDYIKEGRHVVTF